MRTGKTTLHYLLPIKNTIRKATGFVRLSVEFTKQKIIPLRENDPDKLLIVGKPSAI